MSRSLGCFYLFFLSFIINNSARVLRHDVQEEHHVRVRRQQDGYVYNKPSVTFDLPVRSTTESTQAPTVDRARTMAQHMFYAYPAPGGNTVNIGSTAGTTSTAATPAPTAATSPAPGYNYGSSTVANPGYNYGTPVTASPVTNTASQPASPGYNYASQVSTTASQTTNTASQSVVNTGSSGYGYNAPSPTLSPSLQGPREVSTSAPKYLPPVSGGAQNSGGSVNIGSVSVTTGTGEVTGGSNTATQTGSTSIQTPSDSYLPPLSPTNTASTGQTVTSTSTGALTNTGAVSVPSTAYLPPKPSPSPTPLPVTSGPINSSTPQPVAPSATYIPPIPSNTGSNSGTVSPNSRYLPPGFF